MTSKGQMMLITSVIVSLMMIGVGSAIAGLGEREYDFRREGHTIEMLKREASNVDTRFKKDRENYKKMVNSIDTFTTDVTYSENLECFNVTMSGQRSNIELRCIS